MNIFLMAVLCIIVFGFSQTAHTDSTPIYADVCPLGCPISTDDRPISVVVHNNYISGIDHKTKLSRWVAYRVDKNNFGRRPHAKFSEDPLLPKNIRMISSAYNGMYAKFQTDRGHLAPATTIAKHFAHESFYLSNIVPQHRDLNRKAWKFFESAERKFAREKDTPLYIITGAINTVQNGALRPSFDFWKILVPTADDKKAYAVIFKKDTNTGQYCYKNIELKALEQKTKLQFFQPYHTIQNKYPTTCIK